MACTASPSDPHLRRTRRQDRTWMLSGPTGSNRSVPLTFLAHQAPVLPLKIAAPRWFDGTALVIGSMAPDLLFVVHGTDRYVDAHRLDALVFVCVPLTVALTWLVKRVVAGPLALHLPDAGPFRLRDYARIDAWRFPRCAASTVVLVSSALVGAASHVALDAFTHGHGWVVEHLEVLRLPVLVLPSVVSGRTVFVHDVLQVAGTALGIGLTAWCLLLIGQRRLLRAWYPEPPRLVPTTGSRRILVAGIGIGAMCGLVLAALSRSVGGLQDLIIRVAAMTFLGLVAGCVAARRHLVEGGPPSSRDVAGRPTGQAPA